MRKVLSMLACMMLSAALSFGQSRVVTGQVRDDKGNPVPYATVNVKGTSTGVAADANGNFSISASPNAVLVVSGVGFDNSEINTGNRTSVNAVLGAQKNLQEVVVTALGIRRSRNELGYAAQQVQGDEVSKNRSSNFVNNLSGKVAGLEVRQNNSIGASSNVVLRGVKSLTGDNQALFVVDGVPFNNSNTNSGDQKTGRGGYDYGNAAADINPDDIESISVLKGAAASALYGSIGANGVILITTKKGRKGI